MQDTFGVHGLVRGSDGRPLPALIIRAFDKDLRTESLLGESTTDAREGRYTISYKSAQFTDAEKAGPDLVIRVFQRGKKKPVFESPVLFNATADQRYDITLDLRDDLSEFERYVREVTPLLQGLTLGKLTDEQQRFLSRESGVPDDRVAALVAAQRLSRRDVPAEAFYGLLRQELPSEVRALVLTPRRVLREALLKSVDNHIVPERLRPAIDRIVAALRGLAPSEILGSTRDRTRLGRLLDITGVPGAAQVKLLEAYADLESPRRDVGAALAKIPELQGEPLERLELSAQLASLSGDNLPLIGRLMERVRTFDDLADLEDSDWTKLVYGDSRDKPDLPPDTPGETEVDRVRNYIAGIRQTLDLVISMAFVRRGVARDDSIDEPRKRLLARFFTLAPDFDFRTAHVDRTLAEHGPAIGDADELKTLSNQLKAMQRVYQVAPRYEHMRALLGAGFHSARAIADTPRPRFIEMMRERLGGEMQTAAYHSQAQQASAMAAMMHASIYQHLNDASLAATSDGSQNLLETFPNLQTLFGSLDLCACEHCRSVYSPAAYFVDIMQFVRKSGAAYTELMTRRGDLEHIKLTCENTNTPLPYVDLVNEILEFYVVNHVINEQAAHDTQGHTAEELDVHPQYVNDDAHVALKAAAHGALPLDFPLETTRAYLEQLVTSRVEIMRAFRGSSGPTDLEIASESLKLSPQERAILLGASEHTARQLFGYRDSGPPGLPVNLGDVPECLRRAEISYPDLVELLRTRHINPGQPAISNETIVLRSPKKADCDLAHTRVEHFAGSGLTDNEWIRIHHFLRLWKKLGWSMTDLDKAFVALGKSEIDADFLIDLARIEALRAQSGRPAVELLALWASIDRFAAAETNASGEPSLWARLFLDKSVLNPPDTAFGLTPHPGLQIAQPELISLHEPALLAALRVNSDDLRRLRNICGIDDESELLSVDKVSCLYRHALLARSLRLRVGDYADLFALMGVDASIIPTPAATERLIERIRQVVDSGFLVSTLSYLYRHVAAPGVAPLEDTVRLTLERLRAGLLKVHKDTTETEADPAGEFLESKLALLTGLEGDGDVGKAMLIINGASTLTEQERAQSVQEPFSQQQRALFIDEHFHAFVDPAEAKAELLAVSPPIANLKAAQNRKWVLERLLKHLRDTSSRELVKQTAIDTAGLAAEVIQTLLEDSATRLALLRAHADTGRPGIDDLLALGHPSLPAIDDPLASDAEKQTWRSAAGTLVLLHKIGLLVAGLSITAEELNHFARHHSDFAGFALTSIPTTRDDGAQVDAGAPALFQQWEILAAYSRLRNELPRADLSLLDVVDEPSGAESRQQLAALTGWNAGEIDFLASAQALHLEDADFRNAGGPARIATAFAMSRRTAVTPHALHAWATTEPDAEQAKEVVQVVRSRYDDKTWPSVATPINDTLREKRRAALVSYVLTEPSIVEKGIANADQLFEHFLIDVSMDSCATTSRLKQAAASVQLFVQRCAMGLEDQVAPGSIDTDRWAWMKNYRVWEANRKVFLYPENWIEPELRDDKTPFFKELETHLLQAPLTDAHVERGLLDYLERLDVVADLEYAGLCEEKGRRVNRLHIFGRTRNIPRKHFYRQYDLRTGSWTPWAEVPLDIEVDHLVPVVWNRRLYLFWPVFATKPDPLNGTLSQDDNEHIAYLEGEEPPPGSKEPRQMIEIRLAWSECRDGKWSGKTLGNTRPLLIRVFDPHNHINPVELVPRLRLIPLFSNDHSELSLQTYVHPFIEAQQNARAWLWTRLGRFRLRACSHELVTRRVHHYEQTSNLLTFLVEWEVSYMRPPDNTEPLHMRFGERPEVPGFQTLSNPGIEAVPGSLAYALGLDSELVMETTPSTSYSVLPPPVTQFLDGTPFVFQDGPRSYLVTSRPQARLQKQGATSHVGPAIRRFSGVARQPLVPLTLPIGDASDADTVQPVVQFTTAPPRFFSLIGGDLHFQTVVHPHVCAFIEALNSGGLPALFALDTQADTNDPVPVSSFNTRFKQVYAPTTKVHPEHPFENVDFDGGAYSVYNWELFLHAPLFIADRLSKDQRFEEAQKWFHRIFDPTSNALGPSPHRYWRFLPFHESDESEGLVKMLETLSQGTPAQKYKILQQVEAWRDHPFNPHLIARFRMIAYQKTVVIKYVTNLIAWGDQLFARDTIESINEATQLYVLAANLLGTRPADVPRRGTTDPKTYAELAPDLDAFSNAIVLWENEFPNASEVEPGDSPAEASLGTVPGFYFCIPKNENLLGLWDTVEDRLFKIRHCMSIEGVVRQLPLFEPPIDPALLVKATAMGLDIGSVLSDISAPTPHYRFDVMLRRALEICAEVKALGAELLSALEKKDAEALASLRATHETQILKSVTHVRKAQIDATSGHVKSLKEGREVVQARHDFYKAIEFMIPEEHAQNALAIVAGALNLASGVLDEIAAGVAPFPDFFLGALAAFPTVGPLTLTQFAGGSKNASGVAATARFVGRTAEVASIASQAAGTLGSFRRRSDEWKLQADLALRELRQIDAQIAAAEIHVAIAEKELASHEKQIENAQAVEEFLKNKYTNEELYGWMISQVSGIFFQTYKLAYDLAKRAEKAYRFELGLDNSGFITFGYWDSLRRGLLSGQRLHLDLERMQAAFLDGNRREYEIDRAISLEQLSPIAFITLKETGRCEVDVPEAFFDADYPGHYMRRIKNVRLTLPCVTGPYTNVNCTLTLLSSKVRVNPTAQQPYNEDTQSDDKRFRYRFGPIQSIATSTGRNDAGLFEVAFRDERYLPFEGAGAISRWRIELPRETNTFDVDTLSDVVIHVAYTARDGGAMLREQASAAVVRIPPQRDGLTRLLSARHELPDAWHRFLHPAASATVHRLDLDFSKERFPFQYKGKTITITGLDVFLKVADGRKYENGSNLSFDLAREAQSIASGSQLVLHPTLQLPKASPLSNGSESDGSWSISVAESGLFAVHEDLTIENQGRWRLDPGAIEDVWILCTYSVAPPASF